MKRRDFLLATAAASATSPVWTATPSSAARAEGISPAERRRAEESGPDRDPLQLQRSTLVVSGLDVSTLNDPYLELLKQGGVNCWHKSMGGLDSFSDVYNFVDAHPQIVVARTVREIREAHAAGKI